MADNQQSKADAERRRAMQEKLQQQQREFNERYTKMLHAAAGSFGAKLDAMNDSTKSMMFKQDMKSAVPDKALRDAAQLFAPMMSQKNMAALKGSEGKARGKAIHNMLGDVLLQNMPQTQKSSPELEKNRAALEQALRQTRDETAEKLAEIKKKSEAQEKKAKKP